jgi:hypothetical protein
MNRLLFLLPVLALAASTRTAPAEDKRIDAFSRIHYHRDGTRTESIKDGTGTRIKEKTYSENSILSFVREFETDSKGRLRNGVIYDGRKNVLGSMVYGYDATTDQIVELSTAQIAALTTDQLVGLSTSQAAALTSKQVAVIASDDFAVLETADIAVLSTAVIAKLSTDQISAMSTDQLNALTDTQVAVLSTAQQAALLR